MAASPSSRTVLLALLLAEHLHEGQRRRDGEAYFNHCVRVASRAVGFAAQAPLPRLIAVAYLHDVLEDTALDYEALEALFGHEVADDVDTVSRRKKESYREFVGRVIDEGSDVALLVKLCDARDNLIGAAPGSRYVGAEARLLSEAERRGLIAPSSRRSSEGQRR